MKKKKKKNNHFQDKILKFLRNSPVGHHKSKEISKALHVSKSNYHQFRDAMQQLTREGKILRIKNKRYALPSILKRVKGKIQLTRKGFGFVTDERTGEEIFIPPSYLNTALDGDTVEVQLFAASRGKSKEGQIVRVLERFRDTFVGTYHESEYYGFVVPDNPRVYRDFYINEQNKLGVQDGQKVVVEFLKWETASLSPEARIIEILGYPDEAGVDVLSVAKGFELPTSFPKKVEEQAQVIKLDLSKTLLEKRLDLRDEFIFTIDPVDAKDFDDAVSLDILDNDNYRLGVHIADVSFFVKEGSVIDQEALKRGMSIYLVDRVIPMLPENLSNHLCSLQPDKPKLTISCFMEINPGGRVVEYQIEPSIIQSKKRFSYEEVQIMLDKPDPDDPFHSKLGEMRDFSQKLRRNRLKEGSIDFETPEVRFILDEEGKPTDIIPLKRLQSHELIEEFMLMANRTVAEHIQKMGKKENSLPFIYRVHERPDPDKIHNFQLFLNALGFKVTIPRNVKPRQFQNIMNDVLGTKDDVLIKEVALRTMMKASYSAKNIGHFGLAFSNYTHFTSPIRRYPDLIVHRLLTEYQNSVPHNRIKSLKPQVKKISEKCSERERVALEAERESIKIKQVEWIDRHIGESFEGLISGVTATGLFVEITPYLIEGFIRIDDLEDDYYLYDEKTYSLIGKEFGKTFRLGDEIRIRVKKVNLELKQVDFVLQV